MSKTLQEQILNNLKLENKIYVLTGTLHKIIYSSTYSIQLLTEIKTIYVYNLSQSALEYVNMCEGGFSDIEIIDIEIIDNIENILIEQTLWKHIVN